MRAHFPDVPLVVDAGIGLPSQAAAAMELGYDGVLLNTAVAQAGDPALMAAAFGQAIEAGPQAFSPGPMPATGHGGALDTGAGLGVSRMIALPRFYLIIDDAALLVRLLPEGLRLVQLRVKEATPLELRRRIRQARALCEGFDAQLVINDHWEAAIDEGCDFVHLGQEDLDTADVPALRRHESVWVSARMTRRSWSAL